MTTTRKNILDTLLAKLLLVRVSNGCNSTINAVDRQRDIDSNPFNPSECWAANVWDDNVEVVEDISDDQHLMPVTIEVLGSSRFASAEAEQVMADVVALVRSNGGWGGYADGTDFKGHQIKLATAGDDITSIKVDITIHYTTDKGKV